MLLDYVRPTRGRAFVLGSDPQRNASAVRQRLGVLPESYGLYDRLTARQHVALAVELKDSDDDPAAILDRVGLAESVHRRAGTFSKGMGQRLALAMALVGQPDLLILDEPTAGLDPNAARMVREIVKSERERETTVFFSSHSMEQVEAVCDRVAIIDGGALVAVDSIDGLRKSVATDSTLLLTVDEVPDTTEIERLSGVDGVTLTDSTLQISCADSDIKAEVIARVEAAGAAITDIDTAEASLTDVFAAYTNDGQGGDRSHPEVSS